MKRGLSFEMTVRLEKKLLCVHVDESRSTFEKIMRQEIRLRELQLKINSCKIITITSSIYMLIKLLNKNTVVKFMSQILIKEYFTLLKKLVRLGFNSSRESLILSRNAYSTDGEIIPSKLVTNIT